MIRFIDETGSTNADLADAIRRGDSPAEGEWLVTRRQTAGRGRQGREWFDGAGNFMGSTVVAIRPDDPVPATLGFVAALAIRDSAFFLTRAADRLHVKWPNDVLLDGAKLSGVLLELVGGVVVAGMGVNLAKAPQIADRRTAALAQLGIDPDLEGFASTLADAFAYWLGEWRTRGLAPMLAQFASHSYHSEGSAMTVHDTDGSRISGTFAGLEPSDGALRLRLADGSERVIRAGDVT